MIMPFGGSGVEQGPAGFCIEDLLIALYHRDRGPKMAAEWGQPRVIGMPRRSRRSAVSKAPKLVAQLSEGVQLGCFDHPHG